MLKELKFVMGALSKKNLVPAMTHFVIKDGHIRSYNGIVALSSPIPFDINCNPKGELLYRAIEQCEQEVTLHLTPGGKLSVKSGSFRALVPCIDESALHPEPSGDRYEIDGEVLLKALRVLEPIIGDDASRAWQAGVLLKGAYAYATCNVVAVQYWLGGVEVPHVVNIPGLAVREMLRIGEAPAWVQCTDQSIAFHYSDGRWVRTQLLPTTWPDIDSLLDRPCEATPVDERIFTAIEKLKKFTDKTARIYFEPGIAYTHFDKSEGSQFEMPGSTIEGVFNWEMLELLKGVATSGDFRTSETTKACLFFGHMLRGAIMGIRK